MSEPVVGYLSPAKGPGMYRAECGGIAVVGRDPQTKLARKLVAAGYDPSLPYSTRWVDGGSSMNWASLGAAAGVRVSEEDKRGLRVIRFRPILLGLSATESAEDGLEAPD